MLPLFIRANTRTPFLTESHLSSSWPWYIAAGIIAVSFLPALYVSAGWSVIFILIFSIWKWPAIRSPALIMLLFTAGIQWASLTGQAALDRALPGYLIKQDVLTRGTILSIPRQGRHSQRFQFDIQKLSYQGKAQNYRGRVILNCYAPCPAFKAGETWQLTLRLKPAHGSLNPGGFNYSKWLFSQSIRATGYVRDPAESVRLGSAGVNNRITRLRSEIQSFINSQSLQHSGTLTALAVGLRDTISEAQWRIFRRTGTAHLIAISGLHIGMVAAIAYYLGSLIWRHSLLRHSQIPAQSIARLSAILAAIIYAALAGFALPTLRALLMLVAYFLLSTLRRNPGIRFGLGLVLMVVLIFDPLAALGASLWLSFGAVAAIAIAGSTHSVAEPGSDSDRLPDRTHTIRRWLKHWWRAQWAVFIGLLPLSLVFFQQLPLASLLANLIAIPVVAMLVVPMVLLALLLWLSDLTPAAELLFRLSDLLLWALWWFLEKLSDTPLSVWIAAEPPAWALLLSLPALILILRSDLGKIRHLAMLGLLPLFLYLPGRWPAGRFEVQILDVGQGLSVIVQTAGHNLIYDAGARYDSGFNHGTATLVPFLRQQHIQSLDAAVISHDNLDHYGGMAATLEEIPAPIRYSASGFYPQSRPCQRGQRWNWDGVQFAFLNPPAQSGKADNNASCVLKISSRYGSILIPGDIEASAESRLLARDTPAIRNTDVLISPHHGSKTSSTEHFIKTLQPKLVVISAGYLNRFKHPSPQVVSRYRQYNSKVLNTAGSGWIRLSFEDSGIQAQAWRAIYHRYWLEDIEGIEPDSFSFRPGKTGDAG